MADFYILEDGAPVPVDIVSWIAWQEANMKARQVACTSFAEGQWVSTVFIGCNLSLDATPLLWETMIFFTGDLLDKVTCRTATYVEAQQAHEKCCALVREALAERATHAAHA